jgi:hypothetical protein
MVEEEVPVTDAARLRGWTPIDLYGEGDAMTVDWCDLGDARFTDPFFDDTVRRALRLPFNLLFRHRTPARLLTEWERIEPEIPPTGFIFHLSRCGSTLISRMLAALPRNIVLSEAAPIDHVLGTRFHSAPLPDGERAALLRGLLSALGQRRFEGERGLFVKFDCWHVLELPLIRRAFPDVPWVFVYRHPMEVMASHRRERGSQMVPGLLSPLWFGFGEEEMRGWTLDGYGIRVLERICGAALEHHAPGMSRLVHYSELPEAVIPLLSSFWGADVSEEEKARMRSVTAHHAKNPALPFSRDAHPSPGIDDETLKEAKERLAPLYKRLEAMRAVQPPLRSDNDN